MPKITLVGAGSVVFAKNLICDILQYPALSDSTIYLMDIDPVRLATIDKLARRIVAQLGVKARIESTLDLRVACKGSQFVITTIQVGGYKPSTVVDFEIPAKYGVKQTIADTLGVGGVFRALRSIPELAKVARTLQEVGAPNHLLLNYTNPMAMNMWGVDRLTGIDSVGLCHSVQGTSRQISSYCGLDYKDVSYLVAGINHMAFFLKFEYQGKDAYPLLFQALEDPNAFSCDRVRFEMMRRLGYFVTESSEHQSEYVPYFIHHGEKVIKEFGIPINEYIRRCEVQTAAWGRMEQDLLDENKPVKINRSVEYGSTIIHSMVTGQPSVVYGNVPNNGLISNLTQGASVEVPCLVDKQGIQPTHIGKLPPQLAAIIHSNLSVQELTVEAAVTGRRDYIYQAVMADPHTATVLTLDKIWAMCDELIEAHQKDGFLGEFAPVLRNTGKPLSAVSRIFLSLEHKGIPFFNESAEAAFNLVAKNATDHDFCGDVEIEIAGVTATIAPASKLHIKVAAGKTVLIPFTMTRQGEIENNVTISILSSSAETLAREFSLPKRSQISVPVNASGEKKEPLEIKWSGNVAAHGGVWMTPTELAFDFRVDDTDLQFDRACFWDGSAVELGLKDAVTPGAPATVLVIIPDPAQPQILSNDQPFKGASATVHKDGSGYNLSLRINLEAAHLKPATPFLFNLIFHVNALGTAHEKIRASLQDAGNMKVDQSRFMLAVPKS